MKNEYIALLRGINVGRAGRIAMADLRKSMEALGFSGVRTYIQSGNLLFLAEHADEARIIAQIEEMLLAEYGVQSACVLRGVRDFLSIVERLPFSPAQIEQAEAASGVESLYVALFQRELGEDALKKLEALASESEALHASGREIYLLLHESVRTAKLPAALVKTGVPVTMRNWKTIRAIEKMLP